MDMLEIKFEIGGRRVHPNNIADAFERMMFDSVVEMISSKLRGIRDPDTGEFPVVAVKGRSLSNLSFEITGSKKVVTLAEARLAENNDEAGEDMNQTTNHDANVPPRIFISHASEDKEIAIQIAEDLRAQGIDAWLDQWELSFGDALQSAISKGIDEAGIFLAVMSHAALGKPWVKAEIDAAWVDKMDGRKRFIVARHKIDHQELPGLLRGPLSADLSTYDDTIRKIIDLAFGISEKPPLGLRPDVVADAITSETGLSPAAERIVKLYCEKSEYGVYNDPSFDPNELMKETGLSLDQMVDAVDELKARGAVRPEATIGCGEAGFAFLSAEGTLFADYDKFFMDWSAEEDALLIASRLQGGSLTGGLSEGECHEFCVSDERRHVMLEGATHDRDDEEA